MVFQSSEILSDKFCADFSVEGCVGFGTGVLRAGGAVGFGEAAGGFCVGAGVGCPVGFGEVCGVGDAAGEPVGVGETLGLGDVFGVGEGGATG